jgi:hypothetical protein
MRDKSMPPISLAARNADSLCQFSFSELAFADVLHLQIDLVGEELQQGQAMHYLVFSLWQSFSDLVW